MIDNFTRASSVLVAVLLVFGLVHDALASGDSINTGEAEEVYANNVLVKDFRLAAGADHACLLAPGGVICWGSDEAGQSTVPALLQPVEIAAGGAFSCAIDQGDVICWGANDKGQATVPGLVNPVSISAGDAHACVLDDDGVHCWGDNADGQTTVPPLENPKSVVAGGRHTCALDDVGVHCWGSNAEGQLNVPALNFPETVHAGYSHNCVRQHWSIYACWGNNPDGRTNIPELGMVMMMGAGFENTCAIHIPDMETEFYGLQCWGNNTSGQLNYPELISPPVVAAGNGFICALDLDGLKCWGRNNVGQASPPDIEWDPDGDGLTYDEEVARKTDPLRKDTDKDNLDDKFDPLPREGGVLNLLTGDSAWLGTGLSVAFAGDFDGDGFGDVVIGTPNFSLQADPPKRAAKAVGRVQVISGRSGAVLFNEYGGSVKERLGKAVAGNADVDGDGLADIAVGAPFADDEVHGIKNTGAVRVIFGPNGSRRQDIYGSETETLFGTALALGDIDDDGHADIVVGEPGAADQANKLGRAGRVTVYSGKDFTEVISVYGSTAKALAGTAVAAGDFNGSGGAEFIVGAPGDDNLHEGIVKTGSAKIYSLVDNGEPFVERYGGKTGERFGSALAAGADTDNDGVGDVVVGAPGSLSISPRFAGAGAVYVLHGPDSGRIRLLSSVWPQARAHHGAAVAMGDVDGDAFGDILVGAPDWDMGKPGYMRPNTGLLAIYSGNPAEEYPDLLFGGKTNDRNHVAIAVGDVNADGYADVIIATPGFDVRDGKVIKNAGRVMVMSGKWL